MSYVIPHRPTRGSRLLLAHCRLVAEWERSPAEERLEDMLGSDLARRLVRALTRVSLG
jgi:hypothetical protein